MGEGEEAQAHGRQVKGRFLGAIVITILAPARGVQNHGPQPLGAVTAAYKGECIPVFRF